MESVGAERGKGRPKSTSQAKCTLLLIGLMITGLPACNARPREAVPARSAATAPASTIAPTAIR